MENKTMFILCGEAFSGKSTLAKQLSQHYGVKIVGIDEVYFATESILALENTPDEDDTSLWKNLWTVVFQGIKNHLLLGNSVVVDDNCFRLSRRDELRSLAETMRTRTVLIYIDIPMEVLKERKDKNKISKERHDVPSAWMLEDAQKFERPNESENPIIYSPEMTFEDLLKTISDRNKH